MPFAYYKNLSARQKRIYDRSVSVGALRLPDAARLWPRVGEVARCLENEDRPATEAAVTRLVEGILVDLKVPQVRVRVLAVRPTENWGELHGLYEFGGRRTRPSLTVWMRTAQQRRVVAFRTFLRTVLHEVGHHLDYEFLKLEDSFHTEGFYKREASLFHQLVPEAETPPIRSGRGAKASASGARPSGVGAKPAPKSARKKPRQDAPAPGKAPRKAPARKRKKSKSTPDEASGVETWLPFEDF
jgi:hypothetical protein